MTRLLYLPSYLLAVGLVVSKPDVLSKPNFNPYASLKSNRLSAPPDTLVHVEIFLAQPDVEPFITALVDISDPTSPNFGKHWTTQDVTTAFRPAHDHTAAVLHWLSAAGVSPHRVSHCHSGGCLTFQSTVAEANYVLQAQFHQFSHRETGLLHVACDSYRIPVSLEACVDYITLSSPSPEGTESLAKRRLKASSMPQKRQNTTRVDCNKYTTPSCLRKFYNISSNTTPNPNNTFGIYQPAAVTWLAEDMDLFFSQFQPSLVGQRPLVQKVNGGYMQTEFKIEPFNLEPNLDFQYAMALVEPQPVSNIQVGDMFLGGNINNMLAAFDKFYCGSLDSSIDPVFPDLTGSEPGGYDKPTDCGTLEPPKVLSISYSDAEADYPREYLVRQCTEFLKLGLMGTTVVVSSGDAGVEAGMQPGTCINATTGISNSTGTGNFSPGWPAACPWVTTVGATQRVVHGGGPSNSTREGSFLETALFRQSQDNSTHLSSGGGFSNAFTIPQYQEKAVATYMDQQQEHLAHLGEVFKRDGRGFPDISALGESYLIGLHGDISAVHGTSASAPVVASMISLINNDRLAAGKPSVGFINPALYAHREIFRDVMTGSNEGCAFSIAYPVSSGWDPVTGLGTLDYQRTKDMFMSLQ